MTNIRLKFADLLYTSRHVMNKSKPSSFDLGLLIVPAFLTTRKTRK